MPGPISFKKGVFLPILLALTLSACGNVRFSVQENGTPVGPDTDGETVHPDVGGATPTPTATPGGRTVNYSTVVPANPNQVDILLIIDDSGSMKADQTKLANRLSGFASLLESASVPMDWQMCVTVTRDQAINGKYYWGASVVWEGYTPPANTLPWVLKKGTSGLNTIFTKTIDAIGAGVAGSGDERGLKAAYHHFYNGDPDSGVSKCYRKGAAVAVIVISDEDERSVAGDCSRLKSDMREDPATCKALENEDLPATLLAQAKTIFGSNVRFTFNSIVVGDATCEHDQDTTPDDSGNRSPSHQGTKYLEMSNLTNGGVGSICAADYSANLNLFKDKILNSLSSLTLECSPLPGTLVVSVDGTVTNAYTLTGAVLNFNNAIAEGKTVALTYKCN